MLKGEFIRGDGLVIPNNITKFGAETILASAFRGTGFGFCLGLVAAAPNSELQIESVTEPALGVGGYARKPLTQNSTDWPVLSAVNGEPYIESAWVEWAAVGANFSSPIQRLMLLAGDSTISTNLTGPVFSLSGLLPTQLIVTPTTPLADRRFKYRVYLR